MLLHAPSAPLFPPPISHTNTPTWRRSHPSSRVRAHWWSSCQAVPEAVPRVPPSQSSRQILVPTWQEGGSRWTGGQQGGHQAEQRRCSLLDRPQTQVSYMHVPSPGQDDSLIKLQSGGCGGSSQWRVSIQGPPTAVMRTSGTGSAPALYSSSPWNWPRLLRAGGWTGGWHGAGGAWDGQDEVRFGQVRGRGSRGGS